MTLTAVTPADAADGVRRSLNTSFGCPPACCRGRNLAANGGTTLRFGAPDFIETPIMDRWIDLSTCRVGARQFEPSLEFEPSHHGE
ncbi:hypothetical protein [Bradyrhizobium tropiciagri]|uniref:hypothetical protein n=1 Tax=Bradyrhizobium tropiciagri TaxID=312253 RepID=UPI001009B433|nr:hypothetical protein [Bradyrhizobium tropiciagri]